MALEYYSGSCLITFVQGQGHWRLFPLLSSLLRIHFYIKMKIRSTTSNDLDLDKCYPDHDAEHLRGFSHQLDTLDNASWQCCKLPYNSKVPNENELNYVFGKLSR